MALQLRKLQILAEVAVEKNPTIIFPAQFLKSVLSIQHYLEREPAALSGALGRDRNAS